MAAITWTNVTDAAPELSVTPAAFQTIILSVVNGTGLNAANFGGEEADKTKLARVMLAAHYGTLQRRRGTGGGISSQSEGGVSQSYAAMSSAQALEQTSYGQMFKMLCAGTPARAGFLTF